MREEPLTRRARLCAVYLLSASLFDQASPPGCSLLLPVFTAYPGSENRHISGPAWQPTPYLLSKNGISTHTEASETINILLIIYLGCGNTSSVRWFLHTIIYGKQVGFARTILLVKESVLAQRASMSRQGGVIQVLLCLYCLSICMD